jgi:hypothetical protein
MKVSIADPLALSYDVEGPTECEKEEEEDESRTVGFSRDGRRSARLRCIAQIW